MAHATCLPTVQAFLDALAQLGSVASVIEQGPVLVEAHLDGVVAGAPRVSCELHQTRSAHGALALTGATQVAHGAAEPLHAWIGAQAPILVANALDLRVSVGVFQNDGRRTEIFQLMSKHRQLEPRGNHVVFGHSLCALLESCARMAGGDRLFHCSDALGASHPVRAGDPASAIAYHTLVCGGRARHTDRWSESLDAASYAADVAHLLESPHA